MPSPIPLRLANRVRPFVREDKKGHPRGSGPKSWEETPLGRVAGSRRRRDPADLNYGYRATPTTTRQVPARAQIRPVCVARALSHQGAGTSPKAGGEAGVIGRQNQKPYFAVEGSTDHAAVGTVPPDMHRLRVSDDPTAPRGPALVRPGAL